MNNYATEYSIAPYKPQNLSITPCNTGSRRKRVYVQMELKVISCVKSFCESGYLIVYISITNHKISHISCHPVLNNRKLSELIPPV